MRLPVFVVGTDGNLTQMHPSEPPSEAELQSLIEEHPALISSEDGKLLLVRREQPIGDSSDFSARWSVDHLFVTRSAVPVLVEVKRASDTRIRREVIGQMLDYAANSVAFWPSGGVLAAFGAQRGHDEVAVFRDLQEFLGPDANAQSFWNQVDANFLTGNIKMIFVADKIPAELARIIEFLNEQMKADVRGVELNYFLGENGQRTLVPRLVGAQERVRSRKARESNAEPIETVEQLMEKSVETIGEEYSDTVKGIFEICERLANDLGVVDTNRAVYLFVEDPSSGKGTYPLMLNTNGYCELGLRWAAKYLDESERRKIYDSFSAEFGPLSTQNLSGYPRFEMKRVAKQDGLRLFENLLRTYFDKLISGIRSSLQDG